MGTLTPQQKALDNLKAKESDILVYTRARDNKQDRKEADREANDGVVTTILLLLFLFLGGVPALVSLFSN